MDLGTLREKLQSLNPRLNTRIVRKGLASVYVKEGGDYSSFKLDNDTYSYRKDKHLVTIPSGYIPASRQESKAKGYMFRIGTKVVPHKGWREIYTKLKGEHLI